VVDDGSVQWVLEQRTGPNRWTHRRFHGHRDPLLNISIKELCKDQSIDPAAIQAIQALPVHYPWPPIELAYENEDEEHGEFISWACHELRQAARRTGQTIAEIQAAAWLERQVMDIHNKWKSEQPVNKDGTGGALVPVTKNRQAIKHRYLRCIAGQEGNTDFSGEIEPDAPQCPARLRPATSQDGAALPDTAVAPHATAATALSSHGRPHSDLEIPLFLRRKSSGPSPIAAEPATLPMAAE
jgi:hypothetical protein